MQKSKSQNPDCTKGKLKLQSKEHDLQRKATGEKALSLYCIVLYCSYSQERSKCHEKGRKTRIVSSIVILERPPAMKLSLGICQVLNKS